MAIESTGEMLRLFGDLIDRMAHLESEIESLRVDISAIATDQKHLQRSIVSIEFDVRSALEITKRLEHLA